MTVLYHGYTGTKAHANLDALWAVYPVGPAEAGVVDLRYPVGHVTRYGAKGDFTTDDTVALQAAINAVEASQGTVYLPDGRYRLTASLRVPSSVTIVGQSETGTIIDNQNTSLAVPQIVNKDPAAFQFTVFRDLTLRGGTLTPYALDITTTAGVQNIIMDRVSVELHAAGAMRTNKLLQTSHFTDCTFYFCTSGVTCSAFTANHNLFIGCEFLGLSGPAVSFNQGQVNTFIGCRVEAGGVVGGTVFSLTGCLNTSFRGCYFENHHTKLVAETGGAGTLFEDCHFSGAVDGAGGLATTSFLTDGTIAFGSNSWNTAAAVTGRVFLRGKNPGANFGNVAVELADSVGGRRMMSTRRTYPGGASASFDLVTFARANSNGALTNLQITTGRLTIQYLSVDSGGFVVHASRQYLVKIVAIGAATMAAALASPTTNDTLASSTHSFTLTVQQKAGATGAALTIEGVVAETTAGTLTATELQWLWEDLGSSSVAGQEIVATVT